MSFHPYCVWVWLWVFSSIIEGWVSASPPPYSGKCHPAQEPESYNWNNGFPFGITGVHSSRSYSAVNVLQLYNFCVKMDCLLCFLSLNFLHFRGKQRSVSSEQQRLMAIMVVYYIHIFIPVLLSLPNQGASGLTVLLNRSCCHIPLFIYGMPDHPSTQPQPKFLWKT